jgi:polyisoprenoid-binding protein YceI
MSTATTHVEEQATWSKHWTLDPDASSVEFAVKTFWGLMTVRGRFDRFEGSYEIGPDGSRIELTVDADSVDTGNSTRDKHLRTDDFFHIAVHPQIRFTSTRVHAVQEGILHIVGRLEAAGRVTELEFPAFIRTIPGRLEIKATTTVDQTAFGMSSGQLGMIRRPTTLHVTARLRS